MEAVEERGRKESVPTNSDIKSACNSHMCQRFKNYQMQKREPN